MIHQIRKRTKLEDIAHSLHLYFIGLSLRNTSKAISRFIKRSHTDAIRDWIQKYKPERLFYYSKTMISEFYNRGNSTEGGFRNHMALDRYYRI